MKENDVIVIFEDDVYPQDNHQLVMLQEIEMRTDVHCRWCYFTKDGVRSMHACVNIRKRNFMILRGRVVPILDLVQEMHQHEEFNPLEHDAAS